MSGRPLRTTGQESETDAMSAGGVHETPLASRLLDSVAAASPCEIWGVLNVTPDSFSDGGCYLDADAAVAHGLEMIRLGADVVDVGGESSRPKGAAYGDGAARVDPDAEVGRVLEVVQTLRRHAPEARLSIDTVHASVAQVCLEAGAHIVNDVSMGRSAALLDVVAQAGADYVLMHTRGQGEVAPPQTTYRDVVADVISELQTAIDRALDHGVRAERIWLDPGLGFAKTATQSAQLLARLGELTALGHRVLLGASRKSFIAALAPDAEGARPSALEREHGTTVTTTLGVLGGAHAVRVHDVAAAFQATRLLCAVARSTSGGVR